jgi:hypothetical protein
MRRGLVLVASAVLAGVVGCSVATTVNGGGGPTSAPTFEFAMQPSAQPIGPGVRTGIVIGGAEMYFYSWRGTSGGDSRSVIAYGWLNPTTGTLNAAPTVQPSSIGGPGLAAGKPFDFASEDAYPNYPLLDFGALRGTPGKIVVEADNQRWNATFTGCSCSEDITYFWLQRPGEPGPRPSLPSCGLATLPADLYPLLTAYATDGSVMASIRLQTLAEGGPCI